MNIHKNRLLFWIILLVPVFLNSAWIHHNIEVEIDPDQNWIRVKDEICFTTIPNRKKIHFLLHGDLKIINYSKFEGLKKEKRRLKSKFFGINTASFEISKKIPINHYSYTNKKNRIIVLEYEGKINHPIEKVSGEYARGFSETPGIIYEEGVYLAGSSFWIPWFNDQLETFDMRIQMPEEWGAVSQGKRITSSTEKGINISRWHSEKPIDEIYLIAAKFKEYKLPVGEVEVMAFLRSKDDALAQKYLETTGQYLNMFNKLIGPYPYSKFALIENFWETGYGMPSFTLLGSKIIRFPFILHSSYPHELLHNWWGNGVFVDYESGNWCEGLTAYLADFLIKEQRGQGIDYRKTVLKDYTHYAAGKKKEFPLIKFKARYDALSSSIGYGKSMMFFHMLRKKIGDPLFTKFLQNYYKKHKFSRASFKDIQTSVEEIANRDYSRFFKQWVRRKGIPEIKLSRTKVVREDNKFKLSIILRQIQKRKPYRLEIPVAIGLKNQKEINLKKVLLTKKKQSFSFMLSHQPSWITIDPQFDIMRRLHNDEIPATLSNAFGADKILILLPSKAGPQWLKAYGALAETWAGENRGKIEVKRDSMLNRLPNDRAVWLMGKENIHLDNFKRGLLKQDARLEQQTIKIQNNQLNLNGSSVILTVKNSLNPKQVVVWLSTDRIAALAGLGRKLPHYGKYSYLAFEGEEPTNSLKGQWPTLQSPMSASLGQGGDLPEISLPKTPALARLQPLFSQSRMMDSVKYLSSEELEGRGLASKGLEKATHFIAMEFKKAGLQPWGEEKRYIQEWETTFKNRPLKLKNIIGVLPGKHPQLKQQTVIVCAHYDHLGLGWPDVHQGDKGRIHFGADDNASGVAVMLELAYKLGKKIIPERTILFIAFTGEESGLLGSSYFVHSQKQNLNNIMAVINLDTVGRLEKGEKLMVIGGSSAREWRFIFMGIGYTLGIETELIKQDLDASDQVPFIKAGIPGIQLFSGPHSDYHRPGDTFDKINAEGLVKVAAITKEILIYLSSERKELLTFTGKTRGGKKPSSPSSGGRRVRTGIMPDFSFSGQGVKVSLVSPGSPAEKAGLKKGDILIRVGNEPVTDLRQYANVLKSYQPGQVIHMVIQRDGKEKTINVTLSKR